MPRTSLPTGPRSVVGYHGCTRPVADRILAEGAFLPSENRYDWLGRGVYFWEYAPYRALDWARFVALTRGEEPAVLAATIRLGRCVNLLDVRHHNDLIATHRWLTDTYGAENLPRNTARGGHYLDRLVIDTLCDLSTDYRLPVQTVRGTFAEGEPLYPGSKILSLTHTQVAVRDISCITNVRLVTFPRREERR